MRKLFIFLSLAGLCFLPIKSVHAGNGVYDLISQRLHRIFPNPSAEEQAFFKDAPPEGIENDTYKMLRLDKNGTYYDVRSKVETDPETGNQKRTYFDPKTHERVEDIFAKEYIDNLK